MSGDGERSGIGIMRRALIRRHASLLGALVVSRLRSWVTDRYLGFWWWLLEPAAMTVTYMVMVALAFRSGRPAFGLFVVSAVLPWTWMTSGVHAAMLSLRRNAGLLKTVQLPLYLFPASEVVAYGVRFAAALAIPAVLMGIYRVPVSGHLGWLPLLLLAQLPVVLGFAVWMTWLQSFTEDTAHAWQVAGRIWFFLSPSFYAIDQLPAAWQSWSLLNPAAALFHAHRCIWIHGTAPPLWSLGWLVLLGGVTSWSGILVLQRRQGEIPKQL